MINDDRIKELVDQLLLFTDDSTNVVCDGFRTREILSELRQLNKINTDMPTPPDIYTSKLKDGLEVIPNWVIWLFFIFASVGAIYFIYVDFFVMYKVITK